MQCWMKTSFLSAINRLDKVNPLLSLNNGDASAGL